MNSGIHFKMNKGNVYYMKKIVEYREVIFAYSIKEKRFSDL